MQEAYKKILSDEPFDELLNFIAEQRKMMAKKVYNMPATHFGKKRTRVSRCETTALRGKYSSYFERVKKKIGDKREFKGYQTFERLIRGHENQFYGITVKGTIGSEEIPLTRLVMVNNMPRKCEIEQVFKIGVDDDYDKSYGVFVHTEVQNIKKDLKHVTTLFEKVRKSELSKKNLLKEMAKIHWWMSHLMPYKRGSAAITEMLIKAMFLTKSYRIAWKPKTAPDLEALCTTKMDDFIKNYPNLIEFPIG